MLDDYLNVAGCTPTQLGVEVLLHPNPNPNPNPDPDSNPDPNPNPNPNWSRCLALQAKLQEWPTTHGGLESLGATHPRMRFRGLNTSRLASSAASTTVGV